MTYQATVLPCFELHRLLASLSVCSVELRWRPHRHRPYVLHPDRITRPMFLSIYQRYTVCWSKRNLPANNSMLLLVYGVNVILETCPLLRFLTESCMVRFTGRQFQAFAFERTLNICVTVTWLSRATNLWNTHPVHRLGKDALARIRESLISCYLHEGSMLSLP